MVILSWPCYNRNSRNRTQTETLSVYFEVGVVLLTDVHCTYACSEESTRTVFAPIKLFVIYLKKKMNMIKRRPSIILLSNQAYFNVLNCIQKLPVGDGLAGRVVEFRRFHFNFLKQN